MSLYIYKGVKTYNNKYSVTNERSTAWDEKYEYYFCGMKIYPMSLKGQEEHIGNPPAVGFKSKPPQ